MEVGYPFQLVSSPTLVYGNTIDLSARTQITIANYFPAQKGATACRLGRTATNSLAVMALETSDSA